VQQVRDNPGIPVREQPAERDHHQPEGQHVNQETPQHPHGELAPLAGAIGEIASVEPGVIKLRGAGTVDVNWSGD
jgi:hypothetical protein